ncbi:TrmH family RNA methyltransferase [Aquiflexum sp.]|uniref:TrmH family RNA methyltransferase n=1 Tax=Aquiflexum sp. TaxID=1872584 RepID=UPI003593F675
MLSKNTLKFIKSLHQKKFRKQENAFFVEGGKNVTELLTSNFQVSHLLFTPKFAEENQAIINKFNGETFEVNQKTLESLGSFQTNDAALAVAAIRSNEYIELGSNEWGIALDDVRDPGNLGTIIRVSDWYGINKIILSLESADYYNPKVLHASMGSFTRVNIFYTDLKHYLTSSNLPVYGAFLEGENIYQQNFEESGIILMGNESKGISPDLEMLVKQKITIPRFGEAESLNVAVATAVICDNVRRRSFLNSQKPL